ncbi:DinB superfamily protein [Tenacibaculum sp. MAR_2009_124]|uniref:DinB family protein n=1 Tax=Tenacibaculum sp. MAR_2009_124 TaxID=1250059 RepID=UPI0008967B84|nr:DinB family protein [Tenacibaculum sp. MAR_2009_124]SEB35850.1 DinB superfamily protein [Tenacibaculum sp. MAR_2009_124]
MIFNKEELLNELIQLVDSHIEFAETLRSKDIGNLHYKLNDKSWSVVECIEHLNLYAKFYNKEITHRIETSNYPTSDVFKSGTFGNKFAMDMLPGEQMKKMNTFKSKNPIYSKLDSEKVLSEFLNLQKELLDLIEKAKTKNLTKTKTSITLPLLKFRLGDTFRFVIYHNERHVVQAKNVLKQL